MDLTFRGWNLCNLYRSSCRSEEYFCLTQPYKLTRSTAIINICVICFSSELGLFKLQGSNTFKPSSKIQQEIHSQKFLSKRFLILFSVRVQNELIVKRERGCRGPGYSNIDPNSPVFSLSTRLLTSRTGPGLLTEEPAAAGAAIYLTKGKSISGLSFVRQARWTNQGMR